MILTGTLMLKSVPGALYFLACGATLVSNTNASPCGAFVCMALCCEPSLGAFTALSSQPSGDRQGSQRALLLAQG